MLKKIKTIIFIKSLISDLLMCKEKSGEDICYVYPVENDNYYDIDEVTEKLTQYIVNNHKDLEDLLVDTEKPDESDIFYDNVNMEIEEWFNGFIKFLPIVSAVNNSCYERFKNKVMEFCKTL